MFRFIFQPGFGAKNMYNPDHAFMKQLKRLDPKLGCEYNRDTERFNITYKRAIGEAVPIMQVKTDGGGFRQPDQRDINKLNESDTHRVSMKERLDKSSKYMYDYREKKRQEAKENIRLMTIDDKRQLRRAFGRDLSPKHNSSTFRKILPKSKGQVFK